MPYHLAIIPIRDDGMAEQDLNQFLRSHRVLSVDKQFVQNGINSFWTFCIDYIESRPNEPSTKGPANRQRVDYKEQLTPEQFAVFAKLRDWRKAMSQSEAVPVYAVFTNEQLAQIVKTKVNSKSTLASIEGVGEAKVAKYGGQVLNLLQGCWDNETNPGPLATDP